MRRVAALINPGARVSRHQRLVADLERLLRSLDLNLVYSHSLTEGEEFRQQAEAFVDTACGLYNASACIAVGGDGTVNLLAQALLESVEWREISLGALGTGSSNDFHKPRRKRFHGLPARLDLRMRVGRMWVLSVQKMINCIS